MPENETPVQTQSQADPRPEDAAFSLTPENYYSVKANQNYLSNSLFKSVYGTPASPFPCEAAALLGEPPESEALLVGGYVDAAFESEDAFKAFVEKNESKLKLKSGKGFYQFVKDADRTIARVKRDPVFMSFLNGQHQTVMTGMIANHPFKIKMDDYVPGKRITDLKYVKSAGEEYNEFLRRRATFVENYGYDIQGAIYREIVRQNTGDTLPFYIAYVTKEDPVDFGVVEIPDKMLNEALEFVVMSLEARPMADIRANPRRCNRRSCRFCRDHRVLTGPIDFPAFEARART